MRRAVIALGDVSSGGRAAVVRPPRWDRPRDGRGREALGVWDRPRDGRGREEEGGEESNRVEEEGESAALKSGRPWKRTTLFMHHRWKRKRRVRRVAVGEEEAWDASSQPFAALQWWKRKRGMPAARRVGNGLGVE
jgi:hypothetical protein